MPTTCRPEDLQQKFRRFVQDRLVDLQAGAGGWRWNAAPRIGSRPEDLTTKL